MASSTTLNALSPKVVEPQCLNVGPIALAIGILVLAWLPSSSWAEFVSESSASQVTGSDQRWLPWLGCWQLVEETGQSTQTPDYSSLATQVLVCLTPSGKTVSGNPDTSQVLVTSIVDGEEVIVETLDADGTQHPVDETECGGWRANRWSNDGARLFTSAQFGCQDSDARVVSGISLMTGPRTWLDIELVQTQDRGAVTVRRYRRAAASTIEAMGGPAFSPDLLTRAQRAATTAATTELSISDVIETAHSTDFAVLEALLIETQTAFPLDSNTLLTLDNSGVPAPVIDLMVALSFPDEFVVNRPPPASGGFSDSGFIDTWGYSGAYGLSGWLPYYSRPFGSFYGWSPYNSIYNYGPALHYEAFLTGGLDPYYLWYNNEGNYFNRPSIRVSEAGYMADPGGSIRGSTRTIQSSGTTQAISTAPSRPSGRTSGATGARATPWGYERPGSPDGASSGAAGGGGGGRSAVPR